MQTNMAAGHFSSAGAFSHMLEQAELYAFIMWALSACPDGLSGAASQALVFDLIAVFVGMGVILGVAGKISSPPIVACCGSGLCQQHRATAVCRSIDISIDTHDR